MAHRLLRVNEALREALSEAIADGLKDPRVGFVTVTGVKTSADLRHAKVYVSVLGTAYERERTLAGLRSSQGYLQERIGAEVRLKRTPQLEFVYDESIDRGQRIEKLLRRHEGELAPDDESATFESVADGESADPGSADGESADRTPEEEA